MRGEILILLVLLSETYARECNPTASNPQPIPGDEAAYMYCDPEGVYTKANCPDGSKFNSVSLECEWILNEASGEDPFLLPLYQAQDCSGASPLANPNGRVEKCGDKLVCPAGYTCSAGGQCCPNAELACSAPLSAGHGCLDGVPHTAWYFDPVKRTCDQFTYFGCGGTSNRFPDQESCASFCGVTSDLGQCPPGMVLPVAEGQQVIQPCTLNMTGTCLSPSYCVPSTTNVPICCGLKAGCPDNRTAYTMPGSDSTMNCQPNGGECPAGNECLESSVPGFHLCCSVWKSNSVAMKPVKPVKPQNSCPKNIRWNGKSCQVNEIGACPEGYSCIPGKDSQKGSCCEVQPICLLGKARYLKDQQVQICGPDTGKCPQSTTCVMSSLTSVYICCELASQLATSRAPLSSPTHRCSDGKSPFYDPGARYPRQCITSLREQCPRSFSCKTAKSGGLFYCCPVSPNECASGDMAYIPPGSSFPLTCSPYGNNNCVPGYSCQLSADGSTSLCCGSGIPQIPLVPQIPLFPLVPQISNVPQVPQIPVIPQAYSSPECPVGSTAYLYGSRPLACPPGSMRCPSGYTCTPSSVANLNLCCSASVPQTPQCIDGAAYIDPATNGVQFCSPNSYGCPQGFHCQASTLTGQHLCCTQGQLNTRFAGYCPMGQIPFVSRITGEPRACHMSMYPCPTSAPYQCIYSSEKLDSFCCAPIDTAIHREEPRDIVGREESSGCPAGSRSLVDSMGNIQTCNPGQCPDSFMCHLSVNTSRWQCCSTEAVFRKAPRPSNSNRSQCDSGSALINGRCMRLLYIGQKGCEANEQCSLKLAESRCEDKYCICPRHKLIHQSKCVTHCPDGFVNIAARCHDLTTVVFMDSVDERLNGTIGGFCESTLVEDKQCIVKNAYCNERSITCQCKPGFELKMEFEGGYDEGSCIKIEDSSFEAAQRHNLLTTEEQLVDKLSENENQLIPSGDDLNSGGLNGKAPLKHVDDEPFDLERFLFVSDDHIMDQED